MILIEGLLSGLSVCANHPVLHDRHEDQENAICFHARQQQMPAAAPANYTQTLTLAGPPPSVELQHCQHQEL